MSRRRTHTRSSRNQSSAPRIHPGRAQDPRLAATPVRAIGGEPAKPGTWITLVSQVTMDDERQLDWHPPQPVAFSLVEAHKLVRRAVPKRRNIIDNLKRRTNDAYGPQNSHRTLDVIADLWSAVLHSFAAVEAIANDSIDRLPNDAVITIGRKDDTREIEKSDMVRALNISEKLSQAVPLLDIGEQTKGTRPWERFVHLKRLRDDLVHVKDPRGSTPDPQTRTAFDRLMLGDGDTCARDAFEIVQAVRPGFLGDHAVEYLSQ